MAEHGQADACLNKAFTGIQVVIASPRCSRLKSRSVVVLLSLMKAVYAVLSVGCRWLYRPSGHGMGHIAVPRSFLSTFQQRHFVCGHLYINRQLWRRCSSIHTQKTTSTWFFLWSFASSDKWCLTDQLAVFMKVCPVRYLEGISPI